MKLYYFVQDLPDLALEVGTDYSVMFQIDGYFFDSENAKEWARFMGGITKMVLVTQRSWKNKRNGLGVFRLVCEYYGYPRDTTDVDKDFPPSSNRDGKSKKIGCAFELEGREYEIDKWRVFVICGSHNHDLPDNLFGHAFAGRLTPKQHQKVRRGAMIGIKPRDLLSILKDEDPECVTSIRQVYNSVAKMKRAEAEGRGDIQQALHSLHEKKYHVVVRRVHGSSQLSDLMFSHPGSQHLLRLFPYVIVMDATYKTNEYVYPFPFVNFTT